LLPSKGFFLGSPVGDGEREPDFDEREPDLDECERDFDPDLDLFRFLLLGDFDGGGSTATEPRGAVEPDC
jgi:hypothetical protein